MNKDRMWRRKQKLLEALNKHSGLILVSAEKNDTSERHALWPRVKSIFENIKIFVNPTSYALSVLVGGLLLVPYYSGINYFPDLELKDIVWLTVLIAILCGGGVIVIGGALVYPGLLWRGMIANNTKYAALGLEDEGKGYGKLWIWFGVPLMLCSTVIAASTYFIITVVGLNKLRSSFVFVLIQLAVLVVVSLLPAFLTARRKGVKLTGEQYFALSWTSIMASIILVVAVYTVSAIAISGAKNFDAVIIIGPIVFLFLIGANVMLANPLIPLVASKQKDVSVMQMVPVVILLVLVLLVLYAGLLGNLSSKMVRLLGLGNVENVSLVLNQDGIRALPALDIQACTCKDQPALLRNIHLLSRLGNEYYLKCTYTTGDFDDEHRVVLFTLPKSVVVSVRNDEKISKRRGNE